MTNAKNIRPRHLMLLSVMLTAAMAFLASAACALPPAGKTAANLIAAYKAELTASAKYAAYAAQAGKEGYPQIAVMFEAVSRSAGIHAANHKTVLGKMGLQAPEFTPEVTARSTRENLEDAIKGETEQTSGIYPGFVAAAKDENETDAAKSLRWAMDTEKRHLPMYSDALGALAANSLNRLPKFYWVCPKCGNTYNVGSPEKMCGFCGTSNSRFIKVSR